MGFAQGGCWPPHGPRRGSAQGGHPLSGECLGESDGFPACLADVGVVEEPVHGRGGECLGHELIEPGRVQVRGDSDGAFLVGGVHEPVQSLGGVVGDREEANVIHDHDIGAQDAGDGLGDGVIGAVPAQQVSEVLQGEPRDPQALYDGVLAEGFQEERLPGPGRVWLRSLGGGVFAALRGGLVAAITQDWLQVGVAV